MRKKIGLFFGTFNPIHTGHLIIANHMAEYSDLDEIWLVVTPHNPFKKKKTLLDNHHRLEMVYRACEPYPKLKPSKIEFDLPQPNYTINTLIHLAEKYPDLDFSLIMGEDNLISLHKWKNYEAILEDYNIYVYPRIAEGDPIDYDKFSAKVTRIQAPILQISSTAIRKGIKEGKNVRPLLPYEVWAYTDEMNFYK
ncbi:nicotinate (nicotinamide) nucleotide adenylyltransferase [Gramella sp. AN32]|uniref:Probable nicotinate-nucleotide adenylyltransferase n=1 Tax=Christiangramia antarctica TaxID=2058158 RepID=A0ABW5X318_9FLAO|nr:nicotinate (nicotinamide) nucleotide adenylyltransferase [Gramella sp. AN32]MCM4154876.1 nicotinic acid mononucleotide adenylyltransferase [Gramella sp. AN32]